MSWLTDLTTWLVDLVKRVITAIWDFWLDVVIELADLVFSLIATAVAAIPVPEFITSYSLGSLIGKMDQDILFFVGILQIPLALSFLAAGFGVRMVRKAVTLFQW